MMPHPGGELDGTESCARHDGFRVGQQKLSVHLLSRLARSDPDNLAVCKKLIELPRSRKDHEAASDWTNQAVEIDVADASIHLAFAEPVIEAHNHKEAVREFDIIVALSLRTRNTERPGPVLMLNSAMAEKPWKTCWRWLQSARARKSYWKVCLSK